MLASAAGAITFSGRAITKPVPVVAVPVGTITAMSPEDCEVAVLIVLTLIPVLDALIGVLATVVALVGAVFTGMLAEVDGITVKVGKVMLASKIGGCGGGNTATGAVLMTPVISLANSTV